MPGLGLRPEELLRLKRLQDPDTGITLARPTTADKLGLALPKPAEVAQEPIVLARPDQHTEESEFGTPPGFSTRTARFRENIDNFFEVDFDALTSTQKAVFGGIDPVMTRNLAANAADVALSLGEFGSQTLSSLTGQPRVEQQASDAMSAASMLKAVLEGDASAATGAIRQFAESRRARESEVAQQGPLEPAMALARVPLGIAGFFLHEAIGFATHPIRKLTEEPVSLILAAEGVSRGGRRVAQTRPAQAFGVAWKAAKKQKPGDIPDAGGVKMAMTVEDIVSPNKIIEAEQPIPVQLSSAIEAANAKVLGKEVAEGLAEIIYEPGAVVPDLPSGITVPPRYAHRGYRTTKQTIGDFPEGTVVQYITENPANPAQGLVRFPDGTRMFLELTPETMGPGPIRLPPPSSRFYKATVERGVKESPAANFERAGEVARELVKGFGLTESQAINVKPSVAQAARMERLMTKTFPEDAALKAAVGFFPQNAAQLNFIETQKPIILPKVRPTLRTLSDTGLIQQYNLADRGKENFSSFGLSYLRDKVYPRSVRDGLLQEGSSTVNPELTVAVRQLAEPKRALKNEFLENEKVVNRMDDFSAIDRVAELNGATPEMVDLAKNRRRLMDSLGFWQITRSDLPMDFGDFRESYLNAYIKSEGNFTDAVDLGVPKERKWFWDYMEDVGFNHAEKIARNPLLQDIHYINALAERAFMEPVRQQMLQMDIALRKGVPLSDVEGNVGKGVRIRFDPQSGAIGDSLANMLLSGPEKIRRGDTVQVEVVDAPTGRLSVRKMEGGKPVGDPIKIKSETLPAAEMQEHFRVTFPKELADAHAEFVEWRFNGGNAKTRLSEKLLAQVDVPRSTAQTMTRLATGFIYGGWMGIRPASVFKNLTQGPTLGMSITGRKAYAQGLKDAATPEGQAFIERLGIPNRAFVESVKTEAFSVGGGKAVDFIDSAVRNTMFFFQIADKFNRVGSVLGARAKIREQGKDFKSNLPDAVWNRAVDSAVRKGRFEEASTIYAAGTEVFSQWWYDRANRPEVMRNADFLSIFTSWPLNFAETQIGNMKLAVRAKREAGQFTVKDPNVVNMFRYAAASWALMLGAKATVNADIGNWFFTGPLQSSVSGLPIGIEIPQAALTIALNGAQQVATGGQEMSPFEKQQMNDAFDTIGSLLRLPGMAAIGDLEAAQQLSNAGHNREALAAFLLGRSSVGSTLRQVKGRR